MLNKADLLKIVAAEVDHVKKEKKKKSPPEDTTWKKVVKIFNDATVAKYKVALATGEAYKLKATANKILATFGGNLDTAKQVIEYYVDHYEELPFVRAESFRRPLFTSVSPFAARVMEYMETRQEFVQKAADKQIASIDNDRPFIIPGLEEAF